MNRLYDRIFACNAMSAIANSMGDLSEGLSGREVEEKFGFLDQLLSQDEPEKFRYPDYGPIWHYHAHHRPPGMTEDGQERHRLVVEAIIRKGGRVTVFDVAKAWVELIDPSRFGYLLGPQDQVIYYGLKAGIFPSEIGRHATWPGFHGTAKMMQPIGLVNACNPAQAARDAQDVGRIKDTLGRQGNYALEVAAGVAAGTAEALKPQATVGSVIDTVLSQLSNTPRAAAEEALEWAKQGDWRAVRDKIEKKYEGQVPWNAVEVIASSLAVFHMADGDPKQCLLISVTFGRDCDDRAYDTTSWATAMHGLKGIPEEWVRTVDDVLKDDPYTVSKRSLKDGADGLYKAAVNVLEESKAAMAAVEALM